MCLNICNRNISRRWYLFLVPISNPYYISEGCRKVIPQFGGLCEFGDFDQYKTWRRVVRKGCKEYVEEKKYFSPEELQEFILTHKDYELKNEEFCIRACNCCCRCKCCC
jgi:hypothetical protein